MVEIQPKYAEQLLSCRTDPLLYLGNPPVTILSKMQQSSVKDESGAFLYDSALKTVISSCQSLNHTHSL